MAPEVFRSEAYGCSADLFSAGVVMHILLTGRPPFSPPVHWRTIDEHLRLLYTGPDFNQKPLPSVTLQGRDLLEWLLMPDAQKRCTAPEAFRHAWLQAPGSRFGFAHSTSNATTLWKTSASELSFLHVMGVWSGSTSNISMGNQESLHPIAEAEGEADEGLMEEFCFRLVRQMKVPVCIANPELHDCPVVVTSAGFQELTGYSESEIVGQNCRLLNAPFAGEIPTDTREQLRQAARGTQSFLGILPNARADGTRFENLLHLAPIDIYGHMFIVGVQMEVESRLIDIGGHDIVGSSRKVHSAIRHCLRNPSWQFTWSRSTSAP